jgi:hypothetical protein
MITEKHIVFNCLTGQYVYFDSKEEVASAIIKNALDLYYTQTSGFHYKVVYVDETGREYENTNSDQGAELPEELLAEYVGKINENIQP